MFYLFLRESKRASKGQRESGKGWGQKIWSGLYTDNREPDMGLELMNGEIMTWAEVKCLNLLNHPGAPKRIMFENT